MGTGDFEVPTPQEKRVKTLRRELEGWREVLAGLHSLLIWDKPFYPAVITAVVTLLFTFVWYFDPSVLSLISIVGLLVTLADYLVPQVSPMVFGSINWTGSLEKRYETIVTWIACVIGSFSCCTSTLTTFKANRPKMYFLTVTGSLITIGWMGATFNNLFLTYCVVVFMLLLPGIKKQGIFEKQFAMLMTTIANFMAAKKDKKQ